VNNYGEEIIKRLEKAIDLSKELFVVDYVSNDPFEKIIAIILSQNTSDKNAIKALENLKNKIGISRESLLKASVESIEEAIKPGGLYREKARRIKALAEYISDRVLEEILKMPVEKARKELLKFPGIGKKTADVFLALYGKETIGVDTHAARVAKRLGIAPPNADYEGIRKVLMKVFSSRSGNYDIVHRFLIALGRRWCRANKPACSQCPLRDLCSYSKKS